MKLHNLLFPLLLVLTSCTIFDEIFPEEKVQVVDPIKRKPLLNGSLTTNIGLNQNNSINRLYPIPPAPLQQAPIIPAAPIAPEYNPQPIALPVAPVFQNPYPVNAQISPVITNAPAVPVPSPQVSSQPLRAVQPEVNAKLQYPKLSEIKAPEVVRKDASLDMRVEELKRELEISKRPVQSAAIPATPVRPGITQMPRPVAQAPIIPEPPRVIPQQTLRPIPNTPIIRAPIASAPPVQPEFYAPKSRQQAITMPHQLRMPSKVKTVKYYNQPSNNIAKEDFIDGYVHNPNKTYRHSNLRSGR